MFYFENKPIQDWTLAEAKTYCFYNSNKTCPSNTSCALYNSHSCTHTFANMEFKSNTIPQFTHDEIAFCCLIKKIYPWANYVTRNKFNDLKFIELFPRFDKEGRNEVGTTGCLITIQSDFFLKLSH